MVLVALERLQSGFSLLEITNDVPLLPLSPTNPEHMRLKLSAFPVKRAIVAWLGLGSVLALMITRLTLNRIDNIHVAGALWLIPCFLLCLFINLSIIPKAYQVFYDEQNIHFGKTGKWFVIPLHKLVKFESNCTNSLNPFAAYNNCCLTFIDTDNQLSCICFYSDKVKLILKQRALTQFIVTVKTQNPEFKYEKLWGYLTINL